MHFYLTTVEQRSGQVGGSADSIARARQGEWELFIAPLPPLNQLLVEILLPCHFYHAFIFKL